MGLIICPPHVNYSVHNFSVKRLDGSEQRALFMGLDQVKELTRQTIQRIIRSAPFTTVEDFLARVDPRAQEVENLVRVGALDGLGKIPSILRRLQNGRWRQNQMSLFEWADSSEDDWTLQQKVDAQLDLLGVSVAAHPLELVADKLAETGAVSTLEAAAIVGRRVTVAGVQQASHRSLMAKGVMMLFLSVEDLQGTLDAILFPEIYRQAKSLISSSMPFFAHGNYGDGYRTRGTFLESGKSCLVAMNVKLNSCLLCKCSCSKAAIEYGDMKRETCGGYHISPMKEEKRNSLTSPNELICTGIDTYYS